MLLGLAAAAAVALVALVLNRSGIAALELGSSRTVPSVAAGALLLIAAGLAWRLLAASASGPNAGRSVFVAAVLSLLAVEQASSLHEWIRVWSGAPWALAFGPLAALAIVAFTIVGARLVDRPDALAMWTIGALAWLVAQVPQASGDAWAQGAATAALELSAAALIAGSLALAALSEQRRWVAGGILEAGRALALRLVDAADVRRLVLGLGAAIAILGLLGLLAITLDSEFEGNVSLSNRPLTWFNLNQELTFPAYFSGLVLLLGAGLALVLGQLRAGGGSALLWTGVGLVFAFLGIDEVVDFHGRAQESTGLEAQVILAPLILAAAVLGLLTLRRVWDQRPGRDLYLGGAVAWGAAQVLDPLTHPGSPIAWPEEVLEMLGSSLFMLAFLAFAKHALHRSARSGERAAAITGATAP